MEKVRLLDICEAYQPKTISTKEFVSDGEYVVYGANGPIGRYTKYNHEEPEVLMACRGASCGAINISKPYSWINGNAMVIRPNRKVPLSKKYLQYYLIFAKKDSIISGTAQPQITRQNMQNFLISICSLFEQERIVARIEELFSELDSGVETLKTIKAQLKVYRQAVLKEVFDQVITGSEIRSIKCVCTDIKVGIVIKPAQYYTDSSCGIKAFRSANVREFRINDADWVYLSKEGHECNLRSEIHTGDVLIVRSGYPGTACVVTEEYNNCNAIDILIAVPDINVVIPEYLCAFTNSPYGRKLVAEKKRGVAQSHLNVGGYSKMEIPVPNLNKQREIVQAIEERLSVYEDIEKTVNTALTQAEALRQSILKQAFEGRL